MLKITGLDKLQRQLEDAQRAFKALDGQLATVRFDPDKPESIEAAIRTMESAIDGKVASYRDNAMVASIVPQLKEKSTAPRFWSEQRKVELRFCPGFRSAF